MVCGDQIIIRLVAGPDVDKPTLMRIKNAEEIIQFLRLDWKSIQTAQSTRGNEIKERLKQAINIWE